MLDGPTEATDLDRTEENRELIRSFVAEVLVGDQLGRLDHYVDSESYTEHNPQMSDGLVALGEALYEAQDFTREGLLRAPSLLEYKTPTFLDMPEVETILIEKGDPAGPFGAKEVGQGPLLPVLMPLLTARGGWRWRSTTAKT